jgi:hypothetical protein
VEWVTGGRVREAIDRGMGAKYDKDDHITLTKVGDCNVASLDNEQKSVSYVEWSTKIKRHVESSGKRGIGRAMKQALL